MDTKKSLRSRLLADRAVMTPAQISKAAGALQEIIKNFIRGYRPECVAAYVPFGTEPGGADLPEVLFGMVPRVLLPVLRSDNGLDWAEYTGTLHKTTRGLREPTSTAKALLADASIILVPALAVDVHGHRLGRGGGSYDRALIRVEPTAVIGALLHEGELLPQVPHEPHDRRVHVVLTSWGLTELDR